MPVSTSANSIHPADAPARRSRAHAPGRLICARKRARLHSSTTVVRSLKARRPVGPVPKRRARGAIVIPRAVIVPVAVPGLPSSRCPLALERESDARHRPLRRSRVCGLASAPLLARRCLVAATAWRNVSESRRSRPRSQSRVWPVRSDTRFPEPAGPVRCDKPPCRNESPHTSHPLVGPSSTPLFRRTWR